MQNINRHETSARILRAVGQIVLEGGLPAVTLSAVCRRAGLSKGGLVHHYPSKESMVTAYLQHACEDFWAVLQSAMQCEQSGQGQQAIAYVELMTTGEVVVSEDQDTNCTAVMLAMIQSGGQLALASDLSQRLVDGLQQDGLSREAAEIVMTVTDGMWFQSVVEPAETFLPRAARIRERLKECIQQDVARPSRSGDLTEDQRSALAIEIQPDHE